MRCRQSRSGIEPYLFEVERASGSALLLWPQLRTMCSSACIHDQAANTRPHRISATSPTTASPVTPGLAVGQTVQPREFFRLRRVNPNPLPPPFVGSNGGRSLAPDATSFLGNPPVPLAVLADGGAVDGELDPFTLTSPTRFRADPPPALTSERYTRDFNEVKAFGAAHEHRAQRQSRRISLTSTAGTFPRSGTARCAESQHDTCAEQATVRTATCASQHGNRRRLDQLSWDSKTHYVFWRPLTAIQWRQATTTIRTRQRRLVATADQHSELSRLHVWGQQRGRRDDTYAGVVLRYGQGDFRSHHERSACGQEGAYLPPVFGKPCRMSWTRASGWEFTSALPTSRDAHRASAWPNPDPTIFCCRSKIVTTEK